jgi:DNA-binding NarL/FixJ family response regulator
MASGTLVVSREVKNHLYYKQQLELLGYPDVTPTTREKDALKSLIDDLKPNLILIDAWFYQCCTPFLLGALKQSYPKIKMAVFSIGQYPTDLAMYFILYGAYAYISTSDGLITFLPNLAEIGKGKEYISPAVAERMSMRQNYPTSRVHITDKQREVIRLICNGYREKEIADTLYISRKTVNNHKTDIFTLLNVRNSIELVITALSLNLVNLDELNFRHSDFSINPKPNKKQKRNEKRGMRNDK